MTAVSRGAAADAGLRALSRQEELGASTGRQACVIVAVHAAQQRPHARRWPVPLDKTIMRLLSRKKRVFFYQWQLFSGAFSIDVLEVTLGSFSGELQAELKKQASFQPEQVHTQPPWTDEAPNSARCDPSLTQVGAEPGAGAAVFVGVFLASGPW